MATQASSTDAIAPSTLDAEISQDVEKTADIEAISSNESIKKHQPIRLATVTNEWEGPDDPENPWNWPLWKKAYHTSIPALQSFTITFSSSVYTPAAPDVATHFEVGLVVAFLPLTVSVLGLAFGPVFSAPLSETFGRRSVYIIFFLPSLLFTLGAGFAQNIGTLIVCRLLAGVTGAGCIAVGAGSTSDLWSPIQRARASAFYLLTVSLGSSLGPPVGGYVTMEKGWRWTQWCVLFIGAFAYLICLPQKETYKKIILKNRAKRLGLPPPPDPLPPGLAKVKTILVVTVLRPARMIVTEPIVSLLSLYTSFNFAVLFGFFGAFPLVFESPYPEIQVYHFNTGESGLVFLAFSIGVVISAALFILIDLTYRRKTREQRAAGNHTPLPPEERLTSAIIGAPMLPISLFWFAWTARPDIHWICCILASVLYGVGFMLVFSAVLLYLIDVYGALAGASAAAANGLLRYVLAGVFPLFVTQMYRGIGTGWATSIFGFVTLALAPLPWIFARYGAQIRDRSAYTGT